MFKSPNTSPSLSKSSLTTGERGSIGSVVGDMIGVLRVLEDEELLEDDDRRLLNGTSELNDDMRELGEIDRDGEGASDIVGLTPRCAKREVVGERLGRGATFLLTDGLLCWVCETKVAKRVDGLGGWNGLGLEEVTGMGRYGSCVVSGSWGNGEKRINAECGAGGGRV